MNITTITPITAAPKAVRVPTREQFLTAAVKAVGALAQSDPFFLTMERDLLVTLLAHRKAQPVGKGGCLDEHHHRRSCRVP